MKGTEMTKRTEQEVATPTAESQYTFTPKVDIWETSDAVHLEVELPGVEEKSVDVKLEEGVLTILGRVTPADLSGYTRTYAEYETGNFERAFRITDEIDEEKIEATLKHGLLHLVLPKREAAKPRRIKVAAA